MNSLNEYQLYYWYPKVIYIYIHLIQFFNVLLAVKSFELFPKHSEAFCFELIYFCGINK